MRIGVDGLRAVVLCIGVLVGAVVQADDSGQDVVRHIRAGALFEARTGEVLRDRLITVTGDRITGVAPWAGEAPGDAELIDLSESFVMPGLMDMHVHVTGHLDRYFFSSYFQSPHRL